jgi:hypothetical protein
LKAWEAIMSSPIHLDEDRDTVLVDAPTWARERISSITDPALESRTAILVTAETDSRRLMPKFSGDRAMLELQRRLALDPDLIPEPSPGGAAVIWPLLTRLCSVSALAALLAWTLVSYSSVKKTPEDAAANIAAVTIANNGVNGIGVDSSRLRPTTAQTMPPPQQVQPPRAALHRLLRFLPPEVCWSRCAANRT